jgi:hypothetical protein
MSSIMYAASITLSVMLGSNAGRKTESTRRSFSFFQAAGCKMGQCGLLVLEAPAALMKIVSHCRDAWKRV